jgi:hypothetical protein
VKTGLQGADPSFVGPEAYTILGVLFMKKEHKITNTKGVTKAIPYSRACANELTLQSASRQTNILY